MTAREVIAYAITHAGRDAKGKAIKGGPYESWGREAGESCRALAAAYRTEHQDMAEEVAADARNAGAKHARVIRIVRARPFKETIPVCGTCGYDAHGGRDEESEPASSPSEASAVEVLRSFIAWVDCDDSDEEASLRPIEEAARRVLAASGPDPMPVVRAAMRETEAEEAFDRVALKGRSMNAAADAIGVARANRVEAVDAYRKAGGTP